MCTWVQKKRQNISWRTIYFWVILSLPLPIGYLMYPDIISYAVVFNAISYMWFGTITKPIYSSGWYASYMILIIIGKASNEVMRAWSFTGSCQCLNEVIRQQGMQIKGGQNNMSWATGYTLLVLWIKLIYQSAGRQNIEILKAWFNVKHQHVN